MAQYVVSKVSLEKGGVRFCGSKSVAVFTDLSQAQQFVQDTILDVRESCGDGENKQVLWTEEDGQTFALDFPGFTDFTMYTVDKVD